MPRRTTTLLIGLLFTSSFTGCQSGFWPWSANEGPSAQVSDELGAAPSPDALANSLAGASATRAPGDWPVGAAQPVSYSRPAGPLSTDSGYSSPLASSASR